MLACLILSVLSTIDQYQSLSQTTLFWVVSVLFTWDEIYSFYKMKMKSGILGQPCWCFCAFLVSFACRLGASAGVLQPPQQVKRHAQDDKLLLSVSERVNCVCALSIFLTPGIGSHPPVTLKPQLKKKTECRIPVK